MQSLIQTLTEVNHMKGVQKMDDKPKKHNCAYLLGMSVNLSRDKLAGC